MNSSCQFFNLPDINDFRNGGRFFKLKNFSQSKPLPDELLSFIYPQDFKDLIQNSKRQKVNMKKYERIKNYCLNLKRRAAFEERALFLKQKKEIEKRNMEEYFTKHLEEKIKDYYNNYYKNLYKNCSCQKLQINDEK